MRKCINQSLPPESRSSYCICSYPAVLVVTSEVLSQSRVVCGWGALSMDAATNFRLGGGGGILAGGTDSGELKPSTPKFRWLLGFRPLYLENIGKSKNFSRYFKNFL